MAIQLMKHIDYEAEAVAFLERVYESTHPKKPEDDFVARFKRVAEICPEAAFAGEKLCTIYTALQKDLDMPEDMLEMYFSPEGLKVISLGRACQVIDTILGDKVTDNTALMTAILTCPFTEPVLDAPLDGSMEAFVKVIERNTVNGEGAWACIDLYLHFFEHRAKIEALIAPIVKSLKAFKSDFEALYARCFESLPLKELPGKLAEMGLKLDSEQVTVYPAFFHYNSLWIEGNDELAVTCFMPLRGVMYLGALVVPLFGAQRNTQEAQEAVFDLLRMLSDKTRLKILTALKEGPKFTKELIALTGISAATMSHHTSELLSRHLITLEKQGVSLVCHLNREALERFTEQFKTLLLD